MVLSRGKLKRRGGDSMKEKNQANAKIAQVDERFEHLKRILEAIRNVNQLILFEDDPQRLIDRACVNLIGTMGYHSAWIALLEGEAARELELPEASSVAAVAAAGFDDEFEILRERLERGDFPVCMKHTLESDDTFVISDPAEGCSDCPLHSQYGGRAGLSHRLDFDGVTYGTLTIYTPAVYALDAEEQDLFSEVAGNLAFALSRIAVARKAKRVQQDAAEAHVFLETVLDQSPFPMWIGDAEGTLIRTNQALRKTLNLTDEQLVGRYNPLHDPNVVREGLTETIRAVIEKHKPARFTMLWRPMEFGGIDYEGGQDRYVDLAMYPVVRDGRLQNIVTQWQDITEKTERQAELTAIEWMLTKKPSASVSEGQGYGDLTSLNGDGLILQSVGVDTLRSLCSDFLRLLETSSAVYEKNGDYAYGIFSSGWCRLMDRASRALCETDDNSTALASGKWLCHESCWTDCSRRAIESEAPVDIRCHGGLHIYAVPIFSAGEVIGAINFGYGDPPTDADTLNALADAYGVDSEELARKAAAYESRPAFIVELAKQQLFSSARLIGAMVESKCAGADLRESEEFLNRTGEMAQVGVWGVDLDSNRVIWTQATGRIHEVSDSYFPDLEEAIGFYHPEDQSHVRQCIQRAIEDNEPFDLTARLITAKGQERWVHAVGQPVFDAGRCVRLWGTIQDVTQAKQTQSALEASETRYVRLAANIPGVVFQNLQYSDDPTDDEFLYISPGVKNLIGLTTKEVLGDSKAMWAAIHSEDVSEVIESVRQAVQSGTHWSHEFRISTTDGETKWVWGTASHERQADGSTLWDGLFLDITDRKKAERALQYSENLFRHVFDLLPVGLWIADKDGTLQQGNPAGVRIWGAEPHVSQKEYGVFKARRLPSGEEIAPDDWALAHTVNEGVTIADELLEIDAFDGVKRVILNYTAPVKDETDNVLATIIVNQDITEQYRAEEALQESERNYRLLADNTMDVIWVMDMDLRFIYVNPAILALTGYTVSEWVGTRLPDHCDENAFGQMAGIIEAEVAKGPEAEGVVFESEMRRKDDTIIPVEIHGKVIWGESGEPQLLQGVTRDIAERKQADEHLRQMAKIEAVGRLAGGVAHDFNNMLGIILGHTEMILEEISPGQPFYEDLIEIRQAGERSTNLTRQLLAFARKQTVSPKVIDLNETVEGMLNMLQRLIGEDIDMAWIPGEYVWPVRIDPGQIDQILANLCVNARDAIADVGKVTIETDNAVFDEDYCRAHPEFEPGEYAMLGVSDNGCGMAAETLFHLFEPFFTTKDQGKGTGLGLATVYGVVRQNNGFINVYSKPGQGTTFKIYLPRHKAKTTILPEKGRETPSERGHETVLLVEDEPSILKMTTRMLEGQGYRVVGASTPGEALQLATEHVGDIHLLITDVVMPEMNGRKLAQNILSLYPGVKCLFMSGYTANVIAHHGVLDEGVNFIQKPFSKDDLTVKVREVLDQQ